MDDPTYTASPFDQPGAALPPDDLQRQLTHVRADDPGAVHIGMVGDTYTLLLTGADTAGRFCLIDMHVPPGGGPGLHRHDFDETFTVLDGEVEITFRGVTVVARSGETVNVPANAPHRFHNASTRATRMLCVCAPAGQEAFFLEVGVPVASRTAVPPPLDASEQAAFKAKAEARAPHYSTELLPPA